MGRLSERGVYAASMSISPRVKVFANAHRIQAMKRRKCGPPTLIKATIGIFTFAIITLATVNIYAAEVTVFAAASLTDSLKEIAATCEKHSGDKILLNFGASSTLARQIE